MRIAAQSIFVTFCCVIALTLCVPQAFAQTVSTYPQASTQNYFTNTEPDVPQNHHMFMQIQLIDILSAAMCQLTGVDPTDPSQPCLGVDPTTGKIGFATQPQQFGNGQGTTQVGGAVGLMTNYISSLYVPAVGTGQYVNYMASNFGIVKSAYAAPAQDCNKSKFGYGLCGLSPLLILWADVRDLSYALLTILFIAIGIGVMLRFRVDPRTVMTLQNQIPRVIIAILLITFSFAIAGAMIDIMWTATYAGVNFISNASPNSKIAINCPNDPGRPINQVAETRLVDQPISFTNTVFRADCKGAIDNGLLSLATKVSESLGDLAQQLVHDLLFSNGSSCHTNWFNPLSVLGGAVKCVLENGAMSFFLWITEFLIKLIIVITILIALLRLWFNLIKCYLTFLIFVILGPIWIVLGLIPGRPMGFEKWLRIIFANLAVFPLVAFILVFARVITDLVPSGPSTPSTVFVPPLIGNPSISTFSDLMGFGAIMIAPTIPDLIKDRMKATGQGKYGASIAAGIGMGAAAFSSPGRRVWENLNRKNPNTGAPEGALAVRRAEMIRRMPVVGRRVIARDKRRVDVGQAFHQGTLGEQRRARLRDIRATIPPRNAGAAAGTDTETPTVTNPGAAGTTQRRPAPRQPGVIAQTYRKLRGRAQAPSTTNEKTGYKESRTMNPGGFASPQPSKPTAAPSPQPQQPGILRRTGRAIKQGLYGPSTQGTASPETGQPSSTPTTETPTRRTILGFRRPIKQPKPQTPPKPGNGK